MAITGIVTISVAGIGDAISQSVAQSSTGTTVVDESIADSTTDQLLADVTIDRSQVKALCILSDKALTLEYNDGSGTQGSLALTADAPVIWYTGCGHAINNLLAADVTALYVTNASGATARLRIAILLDATP